MRRTRIIGPVIVAASVVASILFMGMLGPKDPPEGIADSQMGLSKTSVFDIPVPDIERQNKSEPGDRPLLERGSPEEPALIPHGVTEYLPITLAENQCMDCHAEEEEKIAGEPTPVPRSHYVDLRNAPNEVLVNVVGARYNCVSCHVSPGDNPPLTTNTFGR